ncbi:hypothetical protein QFC19_007452 [Naganishia cerealis]|uniref:Uncharacterized protein n=1 Tax=Naganishia cerealis TaxID=610337 RepID=A0ACC2V8P4_9TREE|nr:hypothetical protein QFC19_007452 [Naganishia cerealis]
MEWSDVDLTAQFGPLFASAVFIALQAFSKLDQWSSSDEVNAKDSVTGCIAHLLIWSSSTLAGRNSAAQRIIDGIHAKETEKGGQSKGGATVDCACVDGDKMSDVKRFCYDYRRDVLQQSTHQLAKPLLSATSETSRMLPRIPTNSSKDESFV